MVLAQSPTLFNEIKLVWRSMPHSERLVVGTLRLEGDSTEFRYDGVDLKQARKMGFSSYPGLSRSNLNTNGQAMNSFASRLPGRDRPDFAALVGAWGADPSMSDFEVLGLTFGRLPTDMFEFIPVIVPQKGTFFYSDLAGLRNYSASDSCRDLPVGTSLSLRANPQNEFDPYAIEVLHDDQQVAHIKKVHSKAVADALTSGFQVRCELVRVVANGCIGEVIVKLSIE